MSVDWSGYAIVDIPNPGRAEDLDRAAARANFRHELATKEDRKQELAGLLSRNGIVLEDSYDCYLKLNTWYRDNMGPEPGDEENILAEWLSFARDLNLFMCDALIARFPWLEWAFYAGSKRSESYQLGVLKGFKHDKGRALRFAPVFVGWGYVYLKNLSHDDTVFIRQFICAEDLPLSEREERLTEILGPTWSEPRNRSNRRQS